MASTPSTHDLNLGLDLARAAAQQAGQLQHRHEQQRLRGLLGALLRGYYRSRDLIRTLVVRQRVMRAEEAVRAGSEPDREERELAARERRISAAEQQAEQSMALARRRSELTVREERLQHELPLQEREERLHELMEREQRQRAWRQREQALQTRQEQLQRERPLLEREDALRIRQEQLRWEAHCREREERLQVLEEQASRGEVAEECTTPALQNGTAADVLNCMVAMPADPGSAVQHETRTDEVTARAAGAQDAAQTQQLDDALARFVAEHGICGEDVGEAQDEAVDEACLAQARRMHSQHAPAALAAAAETASRTQRTASRGRGRGR